MNYRQTVDFLYTKLPMFQKTGGAALKFDLQNITTLLARLGNPHRQLRFIHVAGTNGKGSSAHMLASVLQQAGYSTGLFTSPHLQSFTERIRIDGHEITETAVVEFVAEIMPLIDELQPSFFEITFAMAVYYFSRQQVDVAVIEVGMGGRLDSTNVITPDICLITNIGYDHQQFLGTTLPQIAAEKAGIIKPGVPVVISEYQEEVANVFTEKAAALQSELLFADQHLRIEAAAEDRYTIISGERVLLEGLKPDLKGPYQLPNILGVVATLQKLNETNAFALDDGAIQQGLENVVATTGLKGRWQVLGHKPLVVADTGHNLAGVKTLTATLATLAYDRLHIVWGMVNDKEAGEILALLPPAASYYFVRAAIPRAMPTAGLLSAAAELSLSGKAYASVMDGYRAALAAAQPDDLVFVGGSTFVVAEIEDL